MVVAVISRPDVAYAPLEGASKPILRLQLIGQMQALTMGGASVLPAGRKTKALLAIIALSLPLQVTRVRLAALLWSRRTEAQARASVRQEVHRLGAALAPLTRSVLRITRDQLTLRSELVSIDVADLIAAKPEGDIAPPWPESRLLDGLDGTDPAFDAWLVRQRDRITANLRTLAEARLSRASNPDTAIRLAERLLAIDRAHEGAWRALMHAYAAQGERGRAIRAYEKCRDALAAGVHAVPSAETERTLAEIRGSSLAIPGLVSLRTLPRLGVAPFRCVGPVEPELASAMADEVQFALARCGSFAVVGADALVADPADPSDGATPRRVLGADLLLSGTLQRVADRLRLLLRLLDLRDGHQVVWTHRFDGPDAETLSLQENAAAVTAAELDVVVLLLEAERAVRSPLENGSASSLVHRAMLLMLRLEPDLFDRAGLLLREALAKAPECASAHAWYSLWHVLLSLQYWAPDDAKASRAAGLAERALALDPANARGLAIAGLVRDTLEREPRRAIPRLDMALVINRGLASAWALSGLAYVHCGEFDEAARRLERYKELVPFHPFAFFLDTGPVLLNLLRGDYLRAVALGQHVSEICPRGAAPLVPYLAALGHLGRSEEAALVLRQLLAIAPHFSIRRFIAKTALVRRVDRECVVSGLCLAGLGASVA